MKTTKKEVETIEVLGVDLDVYFTYNKDFGFEVEAVETLTGVQDIQDLLSDFVIDKIFEKLEDLYRARGWL